MNKFLKRFLIAIAILIVAFVGLFAIYVNDYSKADAEVGTAIESNTSVDVASYGLHFRPMNADYSGTAFIFYPGGKVAYEAYYPLLEDLREKGIESFLIKMPFNLAFFNSNAAEAIVNDHPEISNWYIGGHSLGGAMASSYASKTPDQFSGLILLGAYVYGDFALDKSLTLVGSEDLVMNRENITYNINVYEIPGGNHAQFGSYGLQSGDGTPLISAEEQRSFTVEKIIDFINSN